LSSCFLGVVRPAVAAGNGGSRMNLAEAFAADYMHNCSSV